MNFSQLRFPVKISIHMCDFHLRLRRIYHLEIIQHRMKCHEVILTSYLKVYSICTFDHFFDVVSSLPDDVDSTLNRRLFQCPLHSQKRASFRQSAAGLLPCCHQAFFGLMITCHQVCCKLIVKAFFSTSLVQVVSTT